MRYLTMDECVFINLGYVYHKFPEERDIAGVKDRNFKIIEKYLKSVKKIDEDSPDALFKKAAKLLHLFIHKQPFVTRNVWTAYVASSIFLNYNGFHWMTMGTADAFLYAAECLKENYTVSKITKHMKQHSVTYKRAKEIQAESLKEIG